MKITKLIFLTTLIAFLFSYGNAQDLTQNSESLPLKLTIRVKEKKLCVGKEFTILARLENLNNNEQIIDNRNLWRSVNAVSPKIDVPYDDKKSVGENLTESLRSCFKTQKV